MKNNPHAFTVAPGDAIRAPAFPKSLVETAYEHLLSLIVTMRIPPDGHIGIEGLARELKISQTPIREALNLLEAQKLAYKIPNVGFRAAPLLKRSEIRDLFELRLLVEPRAAAFAAQRSSDETLAALRDMSQAMSRSVEGDVEYAQFAEGDARLHQLIGAASGNRFIAEMIESLHVHLHIFRFLYRTSAAVDAAQEHAALVAALLDRDPFAAEEAMRAHLIASRGRMERAVNAQEAADDSRPAAPRRRRRTVGANGGATS